MKSCYCGHSGGGSVASILKQPTRSDLHSLTSSSRQSVQPTQFVKRPTGRFYPQLGLGHSSSGLCRDFSRRNSAATTVSHCSSCGSSSRNAPQLQRESRVKVLSWANGQVRGGSQNNNNTSHCEHTDNRRSYEQRACAATPTQQTAEGQSWSGGQVHTHTATPAPEPATPTSNNNTADVALQRLMDLQQFRLLNASDCFSTQRQDELRLQQAYDKLGAKWHKNQANELRQQSLPATTPYALRQKLLQLSLQQEQAAGRGTGASCAPLERSCALRFNCH